MMASNSAAISAALHADASLVGVLSDRTAVGRAAEHQPLANHSVHVFVDDHNLFYQIVNHEIGKGFRVDFGRLLLEVCRNTNGNIRAVASAYIAGVVPDDDSLWRIADSQGFTVRRGYPGTGNRSKQDDAYLITDIVATLYKHPGPSTTVLAAGDADYMPPLKGLLRRDGEPRWHS
jgi:hypothetical protein